MRRHRRNARPELVVLDERCLLSGLTPAQVMQAYGLNSAQLATPSGATVTGDGTGETIALVEAYHDPTLTTDLATFDATYGLPSASVSVIDQAGNQTDDGWAGEESLDVEWAHAIAPGANLVVVEAGSQSVTDMMAAVNTARNVPGVVAVSMSWGFGEGPGETSYDGEFTTPAGHTGVTFIAASGDSGSQAGAEWPSASPNVVSVGGTSLNIDATGSYTSESVWYGSGGGYSQIEAEPSYQYSVQTTGMRSTPDVAFDADPNTGVQVYSTAPSTGFGQWQTVGGTSLGAPAWAAIVAIADEGRALEGQSSLDGASQTLPALYALPSTDFHSVTAQAAAPVGNGSFGWGGFGGGWGGFRHGFGLMSSGGSAATTATGATSGANTSTGLGTPVGSGLITGLASTSLVAVPTTPIDTGSGSTSGSSSSSGSSGTTTTTTTTPTDPTTPTTPTPTPTPAPTKGSKKKHHVTTHHKAVSRAASKATHVQEAKKVVVKATKKVEIKATHKVHDAAIEALASSR